MKFILQESKKFILEERFILVEADSALDYSTFTSYCTDILTFVKNQLKEVENGNTSVEEREQLVDKIIEETSGLVIDTKNVKDANIIRGKIDAYFQKVDSFLKEIDPNYTTDDSTELRKTVNNLKAKVADTDNSKEAVATLQSAISDTDTLFKHFMDDAESVSDGANTTFDKTDQEIILNNIFESVTKVSKYTEDEYNGTPYKTLISSGIENLHNNANTSNYAEFLKTSKSLSDGEFGKKISEETVSNFKDDDLRADRADRIDWAKQYKQAGNKDTFWDDYFMTVWGSNAEKVRTLGDAFKQECVVLGFTRETNSFIGFIEDYIIKQNFPVSNGQYTAIHDTVANNGAISTTDLLSPQKPLKGGNMILWYKDFYLKASSYDAVSNYLKILQKLKHLNYASIDLISGDDLADDQKNAFTNIKSHITTGSKINDTDAIYNILIDSGISTADMIKTKGSGKACPDTPSGKIRTLEDIDKLIRALSVKDTVTAGKTWDIGSTDELVAAITTNPLFKSDPAKWAKKFIVVIADTMSSDTLEGLKNTYKSWWGSISPVKDDDKIKIKKELESHGVGIDGTQLKAIRKAFEKQKDASGKNWLE